MKSFVRRAGLPHIRRNAMRIALVVGSALNLINQGEILWTGQAVAWGHVALNYLVPYCVATYSAVRNELSRGEAP